MRTSCARSLAIRPSNSGSQPLSFTVRMAVTASLTNAIRASFCFMRRSWSTSIQRKTTALRGKARRQTASPPIAATPWM